MIDVLLINPPYRNKKLHVFMPMGLGYIATVLDAAGFQIRIHDMNIVGDTPACISQMVKAESIPVVGITGFITQVGHIVNLINRIKADNPDVKIVAGGSLLNGAEAYLFEESDVDIIIRGEGEAVVVDLILAILEGREIPHLDGIVEKKERELLNHQSKGYIHDLDTLPMLNRDLFEVEKYIEHYYHSSVGTRTLEVVWSRGCPYKCVFCINSLKDGRYRVRSVDKVIEEIGYIKEKFRVNDVVIASEVFSVNPKRVVNFCRKIEPLGLTWSCFTRADLLDDELLGIMKESGCRQIFIGIEAADNKLLKQMNKKITVEKIAKTIRKIRENNIEVRGGFVCGLPWETKETMKKARDFCVANRLIYWPSFSTAYPNTALYHEVKHLIKDEKAYIRSITNHHNFRSYLLNMTNMPKATFLKIKNLYTAETMAEVMHHKNPYLPKFLIRWGTRISLYFYTLDTIFGIDVHSLLHHALRKIYVFLTLKSLKK